MIDSHLIEYIKTSLAQNRPKEEIYKELLAHNWTVEVIQEHFNSLAQGDNKEHAQKGTINLILTIGAILIGAGIFSFIAANWEYMGKPLKLVIILLSMLAFYIGGWILKEQYHFEKTGKTFILLGTIIYGSGIFLVAQIFNIRANWPDGFILWMIGAIIMGFATESYAHFYLAVPLGLIAITGLPFYMFNEFGPNPFLLTSSLLLLAATIITFVTGWLVRKKIPADLKDFY